MFFYFCVIRMYDFVKSIGKCVVIDGLRLRFDIYANRILL